MSQQYRGNSEKYRHNILFCKGFGTSKQGGSAVAQGGSAVAQGGSAVAQGGFGVATKSRNPCNYCVTEVEFSSVLISTY